MSTTDPREATVRQYVPDEASDSEASGGGWVAFAGVMLAMVGALNLIDGIAAVADSRIFTANATYVLGDLNTLGWALIVIGSVQVLTAIGVWMRTTGARWVGVAFAALNALAQMLLLPAYPFWSLLVFAVDVLIIYALVVHGARAARD